METRAAEDINMGEDLVPPLAPLVSSLSDSFLPSHCSSCFLPLDPHIPLILPNISTNSQPLPHRLSPLYCSPQCSLADSHLHFSSAKRHLLLLLQSHPTTWPRDTSDLRVSLRLLQRFQEVGLLPSVGDLPERIGGLMTNHDKLTSPDNYSESDEILPRIRQGGRVMSLARRMRDAGDASVGDETRGNLLEEVVFCLVLTNAVEVQVNERYLGIAVYGPSFSWINHSCSPNACYRFSSIGSEMESSAMSRHRLKRFFYERKLKEELCGYGPRIIVRSIKPIKKGEEVHVAYTDLLQPKAMRQYELSKYRFICSCQRCNASPPTYVDCVLQATVASNLEDTSQTSAQNVCEGEGYAKLADYFDEVITEYLSVGNPVSCCEKLENMLIQGVEQLQYEDRLSQLKFKLHPLHYLSLNAYTTLASAYKIRASHLVDLHQEMNEHWLDAFKMRKASAAYSLLLAGVTHHLFLSEPSLIAAVANYWVSAGDSLLSLARSSLWSSVPKVAQTCSDLSYLPKYTSCKCLLVDQLEVKLFCHQDKSISTKTDLEVISKGFLACMSKNSPKIWSFLTDGNCSYFKDVKDPIDLSWIGATKTTNEGDFQASIGGSNMDSYCWREGSCGSRCETEKCTNQLRANLFRFGVHCLLYGGYLSRICYSPHSYLSGYVRNILCNEDNMDD